MSTQPRLFFSLNLKRIKSLDCVPLDVAGCIIKRFITDKLSFLSSSFYCLSYGIRSPVLLLDL